VHASSYLTLCELSFCATIHHSRLLVCPVGWQSGGPHPTPAPCCHHVHPSRRAVHTAFYASSMCVVYFLLLLWPCALPCLHSACPTQPLLQAPTRQFQTLPRSIYSSLIFCLGQASHNGLESQALTSLSAVTDLSNQILAGPCWPLLPSADQLSGNGHNVDQAHAPLGPPRLAAPRCQQSVDRQALNVWGRQRRTAVWCQQPGSRRAYPATVSPPSLVDTGMKEGFRRRVLKLHCSITAVDSRAVLNTASCWWWCCCCWQGGVCCWHGG